jgi:hypothetical protein
VIVVIGDSDGSTCGLGSLARGVDAEPPALRSSLYASKASLRSQGVRWSWTWRRRRGRCFRLRPFLILERLFPFKTTVYSAVRKVVGHGTTARTIR